MCDMDNAEANRQFNAGTSGKGKGKGCPSARHEGTWESGVSLY